MIWPTSSRPARRPPRVASVQSPAGCRRNSCGGTSCPGSSTSLCTWWQWYESWKIPNVREGYTCSLIYLQVVFVELGRNLAAWWENMMKNVKYYKKTYKKQFYKEHITHGFKIARLTKVGPVGVTYVKKKISDLECNNTLLSFFARRGGFGVIVKKKWKTLK